jgi:hypothetical protein
VLELKNSKTTELAKAKDGRRRYSIDGFIGAVQMLDPILGWQDIKPRLVRDIDGWHVEGAPYYAEVKDNGDRLFCPDKYEKSKYIRLPNVPLFDGLTKTLASTASKLDVESLASKVVMPTAYGSLAFQFTNTGMYLPIGMNSAPAIASKSIDRLTLDVDSTYDIQKLIESKSGFGVVPGYISDSKGEFRQLEWSYKNGQLELGFDLTGLTFPVTLLDAVDVQVGAGGDDGGRSGASTFNATNTYQSLGVSNNRDGFFRFTAVTISGTIDVSYIQLFSNTQSGTPELKVFGVDEDNPAAPTTLGELDADPLTSAGVDWDGTFNDEAWNTSPSLNDIFHELIDSYTISNDAVMIHINGDNAGNAGYNQVRTYELTGNVSGAKLHIEFTAAGGGTTNYQTAGGTMTIASTISKSIGKNVSGALTIASTISKYISGSKLVGYDDGTIDGQTDSENFVLYQFTAVTTGTCSQVRVKVSNSVNVKVAVYTDNAGEPGARLAKQDTSTACTIGWNRIALEDNCSIVSGTVYWLAFNSDATQVGYDLTAGVMRYKAGTYSTFTFPDPAGTGFTSTTNTIGFIAGWSTIRISVGGALTIVSTISKSIGKNVSGALTSSSTLSKAISKSVSGTLTIASTIVKSIGKNVSGALTSSSTLKKVIAKSVSGALTISSTAKKLLYKSVSGTVTIASTISSSKFRSILVGNGTMVISSTISLVSTVARIAVATYSKFKAGYNKKWKYIRKIH